MKPDPDVLRIAVAFKHEMAKRRLDYQWPQARDITKTYHYRWFNRFWQNCRKKHGLDMQEAILVLKSIVVFAEQNGLLRRGATLLQRSDQIEIFIKSANEEIEKERAVFAELKNFEEMISDKDKDVFLRKKKKRGGYINLVKLFIDGKLPHQYLCLSKTCMRIYNQLDEEDKHMFPTIAELAALRNRMVRVIGIPKLSEVLKEDLNVQTEI